MSDKTIAEDPKKSPRVSLFGRNPGKPKGATPSAPEPPKRRRPRRSGLSYLSALLSFVLIGAVIGLGGFFAAYVEARKPGPLAADKVVVISREDDDGSIGEQLERAGVIDSGTLFWLMTLLDGSHSALKRGEYAFKAGASLRDVEAQLLSGKVVLHSLTIPEGLTSEQIVQRLRESDDLVGDIKETPREGSLLPETYKFAHGETRQALLTVMAKAQTKAVDEIWKKRATDLPIKSPGELVTLASVVEKETGKVEERPRVAGVFINRLQKHMKLQSDPTIVYGLVFGKGTLGHPITRAELDQATPYNTYNIEGLPPGPICNPGKAALEAVANPSRTKDLFFVADGTGGHAFAETLDQHQKNVAHWRQIEKDAKDRLAPDAAPSGAPGATHGEIEPVDPKAFGEIAPVQSPSPAVTGALATKLAKLGASVRKREALLGAGGSLSAEKIAGKSIQDLGAVVLGVNDEPDVAVFQDGAGGVSTAPAASVPLSPTALADQKAREARYGNATIADSGAAAPATPVGGQATHALAFDASEGTPLDPLLNKTFDLSYGKTVPDLK